MRLVWLLALAGCFAPDLGDGRLQCGDNGLCPPGLRCGGDGRCWRNPEALDLIGLDLVAVDLANGEDLAIPDLADRDLSLNPSEDLLEDLRPPPGEMAPVDLRGADLSVPTCGAAGQPCCAGTCSFGGCCISGNCISSGSAPAGMPTTICSNGTVVTCGVGGAPCCAGNGCGNGCCYAGVCVSAGDYCGGVTKCAANGSGACGVCGATFSTACCAGAPSNGAAANFCTVASLGCDPTNKCALCGTAPQPCCDANQCGTGCCDHAAGRCIAAGAMCNDGTTCTSHGCQAGGCGRLGQAPCGGAIGCTEGFTVAQSNVCIVCGGLGQACCAGVNGKFCSPPFACNNSSGNCEVCGGNGQPCCPASLCPSSANHVCAATGLCT